MSTITMFPLFRFMMNRKTMKLTEGQGKIFFVGGLIQI